jgi:hypothetical protein
MTPVYAGRRGGKDNWQYSNLRGSFQFFGYFFFADWISAIETIENWSLRICHLSFRNNRHDAPATFTSFAESWESPLRRPKRAEESRQATDANFWAFIKRSARRVVGRDRRVACATQAKLLLRPW